MPKNVTATATPAAAVESPAPVAPTAAPVGATVTTAPAPAETADETATESESGSESAPTVEVETPDAATTEPTQPDPDAEVEPEPAEESDADEPDLPAEVERLTRERDEALQQVEDARREVAEQAAAVALRSIVAALAPNTPEDELDEIVAETNLGALVADDGIDGTRLLRRAQRAAGTTTRATGADLGQGTGGGALLRSGLQAGREAYLATRK